MSSPFIYNLKANLGIDIDKYNLQLNSLYKSNFGLKIKLFR